MARRSMFPNVQGLQLRFDFVPQHPISVSVYNQPVECRQWPPVTPRAVTFLYPRFRPSTNRNTISPLPRQLSRLNPDTTRATLSAPYSSLRLLPSRTNEWNSANYAPSSSRILSRYLPHTRALKTIRTMADPVLRTASPYTDPSVKGPRSQQLSTGHGHSLLQERKSESRSLRISWNRRNNWSPLRTSIFSGFTSTRHS